MASARLTRVGLCLSEQLRVHHLELCAGMGPLRGGEHEEEASGGEEKEEEGEGAVYIIGGKHTL